MFGQFDAAQAGARLARLERIPLDCPCTDLTGCQGLALPVLVLTSRQDPIHPSDLAHHLARSFHAPQVVEVTAGSHEEGTKLVHNPPGSQRESAIDMIS